MGIYATPAPYIELLYEEKNINLLDTPGNTVDTTKAKARHRINFGEIATNFGAAGYGFGVERVDFARGSRKTVQQTRGQYDKNGLLTPNSNYYVDVWWTSPPKVTLAGVMEMPAAKEFPCCYWDETNAIGKKQMFSVLDALDIFFEFGNNPQKVKNDTIWMIDYMRKQHLQVTIKDFSTNVSVERPNLLVFQITMEVLHEVHTDFVMPYQINNSYTSLIPSAISNNVKLVTNASSMMLGNSASDKFKATGISNIADMKLQ